MGPKNTIFLALVVTLIAKESFAAQHVVGGSQGWDQSTDFKSWTSGQTSKVGDKLGNACTNDKTLTVLPAQGRGHAIQNCGAQARFEKGPKAARVPVQSLSTSNDVVKLDKPGTRYFTCGTLGHCSQGMKVKITIGRLGNAASPASSSRSLSSPSLSSSTSSSSSPTTTTHASSASQCFTSFMFIIALSVTIMISLF
ncbi:Uclacyanin 1 [Glycine max]|uniref:Uclacyanin 1 n=1 Tax=Glycine soja TaxID=3848 RepID=A0A445FD89_GLYSO|nr:Uclacyanin 1 [Glycine max]RZB46812.1 Uclacyanin 1 [Glycine soja]